MLDKVQYWLDLADDDVLTAKALLNSERFLPMGFFCHLIAEKALKAVIEHNTGEVPPKIHDLEKLAKRGNISDKLSEEQVSFLDELMPLHVDGRYPEYKANISKTLNTEKCTEILEKAEEFLCWIKQELGK
ncbi:MAG: HEPN domain-containing protein [Oscillospiraceae bacterium]|nr:HEPN domain-containing protein [Oscillospiraceae bacterium]